jgi:hypothetical protein
MDRELYIRIWYDRFTYRKFIKKKYSREFKSALLCYEKLAYAFWNHNPTENIELTIILSIRVKKHSIMLSSLIGQYKIKYNILTSTWIVEDDRLHKYFFNSFDDLFTKISKGVFHMEKELEIKKFTIISSMFDYGNFTFPDTVEATVAFNGNSYSLNSTDELHHRGILLRLPEAQIHPCHQEEFIRELIKYGETIDSPIIIETYSDVFIKMLELTLIEMGLKDQLSFYIRLGAKDILNGRENTQIIDALYQNLATPVLVINNKLSKLNEKEKNKDEQAN